MIEQIIKKVKSLPPLPESVSKVKAICDNPKGTIKALVPIVKEDPMFTADILKAANSPLYGFSRQINSVDQAIALFGMGTIQGFAISHAMRQTIPINLSPYGITQSEFTKTSALQNALALNWGQKMVETSNAEMATLSLLMELGKVVASIVLSEAGDSTTFRQKIEGAQTAEEIAKIEKEVLGITSEWIAVLMFKHWKFNEKMVEIMRYLANPPEAPEPIKKQTMVLSVVKEAMPLPHPLCEPCLQNAYEKADRFGLDAETLHASIEMISV